MFRETGLGLILL